MVFAENKDENFVLFDRHDRSGLGGRSCAV